MPTKVEKDALTGQMTTGHEWDGLKELNNPLPRWWLYILYASIAFSVLYWILFPSWPTLTGYFGGVMGRQERVVLVDKLERAAARQATYREAMAASTTEEIMADDRLLAFALRGGEAAFASNCVACHALGGAGQAGGYPVLADDDWLWGGTLEEIEYTLHHGIRSWPDETHYSEMPAYGTDELLTREEISDLAHYVLSLSGGEHDAEAAGRAEPVYAENCAACHGEAGEGDPTQGAPRLNDQIWLYGGSHAEITNQIYAPRQGVMPAFGNRLSDSTIRMLTVYVHGLGGGQ